MTRALLSGLAGLRAPLGVRLLLGALAALALPVVLAADGAGALLDRWRWHRVLAAPLAVCPAGHGIPTRGLWRCTCGMTYDGSPWQACPHCGAVAHAIPCPCGRVIVHPLASVRR